MPRGKPIIAGTLLAMHLIASNAPAFHRDIEPILQARCQTCHRPGEIAPMSFLTYAETRPWAKAIREAVLSRKMPPWFADPLYGHFANDRRLTQHEIDALVKWVDGGAPEGDPGDAPKPVAWPRGWNIGAPDAIFEASRAIPIPARATIEYQYIVLPTRFREDQWVQSVEVRPSDASVVHHAVVYVREPGSNWLKGEPAGRAFALPAGPNHRPNPKSFTQSDILMVYTPGNGFDAWLAGMAKKIKAGSDLVLQMHYTSKDRGAEDRTRIGLVFAKQRPTKAILTLQLNNDRFAIPPGDPDYRVQVTGTLPNAALLLSLFPHMHLRGKAFEYDIAGPNGRIEPLLKVNHYDFHWQLSYKLASPRPLPAGTRLLAVAEFDNSPNNPLNPDPSAEVRFGEQSWEEMMIGFFDVAVDADMDKQRFFRRR
jgi:hypothetical protein